jgi:hypothetical protein
MGWQKQCIRLGNVTSANNISSQSQNNTLLPEGIYFLVFKYSDGLHKNISVDVYLNVIGNT